MDSLDDQTGGIIDPKTVSPRPTGVQWGLILGLASSVLAIVFLMTGMQDLSGQKSNWLPNVISWAVMIGVLYTAATQHRDQELGGYITLGRVVSLGLWVTLISGIIGGIFMFFYLNFIQPDFAQTIMQGAMDQAEKKGQDPEQVKKGMEMVGFMFKPWFFAVAGILGSLFFGLIFSLIIGLIVRKEQPRPF